MRTDTAARPAFDTMLFVSSLVRVGSFHAPVDHPRFEDSGPIERHLFVFPRTCVWIRHAGGDPFVADPTVVTFYNRGQVYRRGRIVEGGDRCEWFAVAPEALLEALRRRDPAAGERPERPFTASHGPSDARTYLRQRRLVRALERDPKPDSLAVEEAVLDLLDSVLAIAGSTRADAGASTRERRRHRELADAARMTIARTFRERVSLDRLAAELGVAPGHLCRVFRRETGTTLHQFRDQLRLRAALEGLDDPGADLTQLAFDLGYSSHSHFTSRFRRTFGATPSRVRAPATPSRARG
jgi:AraC family transcriptional regulator